MGRTGTATDRAAAAVEEAHARAVLGGAAADAFLGTMQSPLAGENAAVFVAVTVADHDLLGGAEFTFGFGQGASEPLAAPREQVAVQPTQAGTRDRMIEKTEHDCRRALEVVDGFEERHDGKGTNEAVGFPFGQSCFLGEEVNGEQVGNLARHADDGRTDALGAVTPHVIGQRAVGSEHGIGLGTCGNTVVEEVVRTREAFLEKGQPLLLRPCGEIGLGRARRGEDLLHGSVVERAVLPDVEGGKVETENFHHAEQRIDVGSNQAPRPDGQQALAEETQVAFKFGRMPVGAGPVVEDKSARAGTFCQGQACDHEVDEFPPRFAPDFVVCFAQDLGENARRLLEQDGKAHARAELLQMVAQHSESVQTVIVEAVGGDLRGDERMAVAIATHPGAEAQARQDARMVDLPRVESGCFPRFTQAAVDTAQRFGEDIDQMVQDTGALHFHRRFVEEHLAGAPEALERGLDFLAQLVALGGRPHRVLQLHKEEIKLTVLVQHGATLGLGGMGSKHGLDAQPRQPRGDILRSVAGFEELLELLSPQAGFGGEAVGRLARAAHLRGRVFLHHVEQMESDRVGVGQPRRKIIGRRAGHVRPAPRQTVGDVLLSEADQHIPEALHEELQIGFDFGEADRETFFVRECFHDVAERD